MQKDADLCCGKSGQSMMRNTGRPLCSPRNWKRPVLLFCQTAARPLQIFLELSFNLITIITTIISTTVINIIKIKSLLTVQITCERFKNARRYFFLSKSALFPLTNLDVMTIFSQSGSHVSVSRRSEALGSFSSANLSQ